jgi:hypothetical protein
MPNTIRIKRRLLDATVPNPLQSGELAYNEVSNKLYYGAGNNGSGVATSVIEIAGSGSYVGLTGTQTITGNKTFSGTVTLSGTSTAVTQANSDDSTKIATTAFVKSLGLGSGSVTSVALTLPSFITVTGSPVTTSGTLTGTLASQTANHVFIAPNGSAGAPTFRALAAADIPELTSSKISNFNTSVQSTKLNQFAAPDGPVAMGSQRISGLAEPTQSTDAATKNYVDTTAQGIHTHTSCRLATAAALPSCTYNNGTSGVGATLTATANGALTVDGVAVASGDRILVKNQDAAPLQNGVYVVTNTGGASAVFVLTRATDMDAADEFPASFEFVEEGSQADSGWICTTNLPITVGTTAIVWTQFSGAGQIDAGNGLTKTGNTLSVVTASQTRIAVSADSIDLAQVTVTPTVGSPGTDYVAGLTVDDYGRITAYQTSTIQSASTSVSGIVQLSSATNSASNSFAATASAVKSAYDLANGGLSKTGGTMTGKLTARASDISAASINIGNGTAPTTPVTGDVWATGGELYHYTGSKSAKIAQADFSNVTGQLGLANGGTGGASYTAGKIVKVNAGGTAFVNVTDGTDLVVPGTTTVGKIITAGGTTTVASLNIPVGVAPTSPVSGDIWNSGTAINFRNNVGGSRTFAFSDGNITGTAAGLSATLAVAFGGTGATSLTGYVKGNGTSAMTAAATIPNTDITGLGTMSTQAANNVAITGGTIDGIVIDGGTY